MDDLLKTFVDTIDGAFCPDDFRRGLLAVLDRLKPVLEEAFVKGFLVSGEGYNGEYPHEFTDGETLRKELLA
ncbi:MAG TPA: hypothetical protein DCL48_12115, partial [Alphaproteobacteria bacterium]|nr:hypothetical protein [Alphaproteobacteria bacterium]